MLKQFILVLLFIFDCSCDNVPVVKTPLGTISGYIKISYNGRKFAAFEGIPYAKPPVGNRRFEEPEPVEPWIGTWNATIPTTCPQAANIFLNLPSGDEDCLHINVYVPRENPNPDERLEVITDIHGGGYMMGSGHGFSYPERPMDRDIIFVTFNYRLGILGFLSTEDDIVPGNNGLKDQALALQWIKNNIASFGGNPDSITLTGISAGGSSVHMHYFSERSKGLFHKGFSISGFALNPWAIAEEPLSKAKKLGNVLGCPTESTKILINCLKQKPQSHIVEQTKEFYGYSFMPIAPFAPVVEKGGANPFLKEHPYALLQKGQVLDVPWINSVAENEGAAFASFVDNEDYVNEDWNEVAPYLLDFNYTLPRSAWKSASQKIREHYFGDEKIKKEEVLKVGKLVGDRLFLNDVDRAVLLQSKSNKSPVYLYIFTYIGDNNDFKVATHGAEGKYLYRSFEFKPGFPEIPLTDDEVKMKDALWNFVVSYAETGKPTIAGVELQPTKSDKLTYFKIDGFKPEDIKAESAEELTDRKFWKELQFAENENLFTGSKDEL